MKQFPTLLLGLMFALNVQACVNDLAGTWKSDRAMSMAFARENSKLEPKADAFLTALLGHMTLKFTERELVVLMPDIEVPVSGRLKPFTGHTERKPYQVLFCNSSMIVWSAKRSFDDELGATTFHFLDPNTIWIYAGGTDPKIPDLHIREYFRRTQ